MRAEPQVNPAPKASSKRISPGLISPEVIAVSRARGMEPPEVLPWSAIVNTTLSMGKSSFFAVAAMILIFA